MLLVCLIIQKVYFTFDPLDSGFITHELGIKLTSKYGLKSVKKVISVDYFKEFYEKELRKREKRRREGVQR